MQTAVVTGGGRGIGLEIARKLGDRGYAVLLTARDQEVGRAAAEAVGPTAWSTTLDVRDPDAHRAVAAQAAERGELAVWVNNAGVLVTKKAWEHGADEIALLVETNVIGMISGCLAATEVMGSRPGHILNVASLSGLGPVPGLSVYAATKAAVVSFTASLQGDLNAARRPIRVHALCPDAVATDMLAGRDDTPEAAVLFSATQLTPEAVAEEAVQMLGGQRIVKAMPPSRGMLTRGASLWPSAGLTVLAGVSKIGERRQRGNTQ